MPDLGRKYACYSCQTKFYDLGKPEPICPKCGANQNDAEQPVATPSRSRRVVVEEPPEEEIESTESESSGDEEEEIVGLESEEPEDEGDDEEEEY